MSSKTPLRRGAATLLGAALLSAPLLGASPASAAPAQASAKSATVSKAVCEKYIRTFRPSWAIPGGWTYRCVAKRVPGGIGTYDTGKRLIEVSTLQSTASAQRNIPAVWNAVPKAHRNNPLKDCTWVVGKKWASVLKTQAPGWKGACSGDNSFYVKYFAMGNIWGVMDPGKKAVLVFYKGQTFADLEETFLHEVGHAVAAPWTQEEIAHWESLTKSAWEGGDYASSGAEGWAESYAGYMLKRKPFGGYKVSSPSTVTKQLAFVAAN